MTLREDGFRRARAVTGTLVAASLAGTGIGAAALWVATTQAFAADSVTPPTASVGSQFAMGDSSSEQLSVYDGGDERWSGCADWDSDHDDHDHDDDHDDDDDDHDDDDDDDRTERCSAESGTTNWNLGGAVAPVPPSSQSAPNATSSGS